MEKDILTNKKRRLFQILYSNPKKGISKKELLKEFSSEELENIIYLANFGMNEPRISIEKNRLKLGSTGINYVSELKKDEILEEQHELAKEQKNFNDILVNANAALALGIFLQICLDLTRSKIDFSWANQLGLIGILIVGIEFIALLFLLVIMCKLIHKILTTVFKT